jgi:PAS domain S-box-containing protein
MSQPHEQGNVIAKTQSERFAMTNNKITEVKAFDGGRATALESELERARRWNASLYLLGVLKSDGYFESCNPAWGRTLGWTEEELLNIPVLDMIHPEDVETTSTGFEEVQRGQPLVRFENRYRCKDGEYRSVSWAATLDHGKVYCSGRDVTAEQDAGAELASTREALRQSQKMEAVGQLTGGIAHDFNNLLTGISGSLEMLGTRLTQGRLKDVERYIVAARGAAKRAAALSHRLLAFSRRQALDPQPTDVERLIAEMEDMIRRTVGPAVRIEVVRTAALWKTRVDKNQLENALLNLCINARDAMPKGGSLMIETRNQWIDERSARERDLTAGQYVSISVSDTGTGMTQEVVAHAFEPFFTTKPIGAGTGLGLSMIQGFARQSGGQVRIYSELGKGTMVCLYLPRHLGDQEKVSVPIESCEVPRALQGETVLVVDDEPTVRMLVTDVLEELGYTVLEAGNGTAALKILQSDVRIDLLVTDVGLPGGLNGRQVADVAQTLRPRLQVLFITGYAENAVLSHGHLDAGMHVLTKPFLIEAFASRVSDLIAAIHSPVLEHDASGTASMNAKG